MAAFSLGEQLILIRPSSKDLERLKVPLGELLLGTPEEAIPKLRNLVKEAKPPMVTTVGDVVSRETLKAGLKIDVRIVDNRSMRKSMPSETFPAKRTYQVRNPPGVITMEAWEAVKQAVRHRNAVVLVDGEEDLLALLVVAESPDNAFVVYGQPSEGLVVIITTPSKKAEIRKWLNAMPNENYD